MLSYSLVGAAVFATASAVGGGGWLASDWIHNNLASKEEVLIAGAKADLLLDARINALRKQRDDLKGKKKKDAEDLRDLDYLDKQIEYLQKIQRGQIK